MVWILLHFLVALVRCWICFVGSRCDLTVLLVCGLWRLAW